MEIMSFLLVFEDYVTIVPYLHFLQFKAWSAFQNLHLIRTLDG